MNSIVIDLFNIVASLVAMLLIFVIRQALNNAHLKRNDPKPVTNQRKISFFSASALIVLSMTFQNYWLINTSTITTGLLVTVMLAGAGWILAVSLVSMKLQEPRQPGLGGTTFGRMVASFRAHHKH
jgi:archaellum biogenesis protein FlaJ (TadC family)